MFFLGIFSPFFQSHSSLCSFKKNKNLLKEKFINHCKAIYRNPLYFLKFSACSKISLKTSSLVTGG